MKKKILAAGAAVAIAAVAVINMDLASGKQQELSSIQLANIEALAHFDGDKGDDKDNCSKQCISHPEYVCITPYGLVEKYKCADHYQ